MPLPIALPLTFYPGGVGTAYANPTSISGSSATVAEEPEIEVRLV